MLGAGEARDLDDVEMVDRVEFLALGGGRAGHAGELAVEAEIVLEGDRREGLVLLLDLVLLKHPSDRVTLLLAPSTSCSWQTAGCWTVRL